MIILAGGAVGSSSQAMRQAQAYEALIPVKADGSIGDVTSETGAATLSSAQAFAQIQSSDGNLIVFGG